MIQADRELDFRAFEVESCLSVDVEQDAIGHKMQMVPGFVFND